MNKRILKAVIANAVDTAYGSVQPTEMHAEIIKDTLGLSIEQARVAVNVTCEVAGKGDWQFHDDSDEYSLEVVRAFINRKVTAVGDTYTIDGNLEEFIQSVHKELVQ